MKGQRGFTLLELLMVVIIIAILASIALPQYLRVSERSRASEALTILSAVRASEMRFKALNGSTYTTTLTQLDTDIPASTLYTYMVSGAGAGANAIATRQGGGTYGGATVQLDLDTGKSCASDDVYGLTTPVTC